MTDDELFNELCKRTKPIGSMREWDKICIELKNRMKALREIEKAVNEWSRRTREEKQE